jgi:hypothetical protein
MTKPVVVFGHHGTGGAAIAASTGPVGFQTR